MLTTTLNDIRAKSPCADGWTKLLKHLGKTEADDAPLPFTAILESNGLQDTLWCLRALPSEYDGPVRELACDFAESVLKYVPEGEDRPRLAIAAARAYARGEGTEAEMRAAAEAAARAADAAAWVATEAGIDAGAADAAWAAEEEQEAIFKAWLDRQV